MLNRQSRPLLRALVALLLAGGAVQALPALSEAQTLRGGTASLDRQNAQAESHGFTYLDTPDQVRRFVSAGYLVPIVPNRDFDLHNVSFPYSRPEVRLFIERLAAQYRSACGEKLVVTSLTRPRSNQPWNASSRSVHPTGMAVDFRRSGRAACRGWLERTLLSLEREGLLEAIYERNPPHYHVAVYPRPYVTYVARLTGSATAVAQAGEGDRSVELEWITHRVARGETLAGIGRRFGVAVSRLQAENGIRGSRILVGQELRVPVYRTVAALADPAPVPEAPAGDEGPHDAASPTLVAANLPATAGPDGEGGGSQAGGAAPAATVHRVGAGESLWSIARRYGVSEVELRAANGIRGNRILAGQELRIPGGSVVASGAGSVRHTVRPGESLWIIARRHGVTVDELRRTNGIRSSRIHPGQVLDVPVSR